MEDLGMFDLCSIVWLINEPPFPICASSCENLGVFWEIENLFLFDILILKSSEGIPLVNLFLILCKQHRNFYCKGIYRNAVVFQSR